MHDKRDRMIQDGIIQQKDNLVDETFDFPSSEFMNSHCSNISHLNDPNINENNYQNNKRQILFIAGVEKQMVEFDLVFKACPLIAKNENLYNLSEEV